MTTTLDSPVGAASSSGRVPLFDAETRFRRDIQGMRALAVLLVLAWHSSIPGISAGYVGVDVFFVVSGYLITGILVKERVEHGSVAILSFALNRVKRLAPLAASTVALTLIAATVMLPATRWASLAGDAVASSLYFMNWHLASASVDYVAQDAAPSALQHYWSLAVEEQFYLAWPLLIGLATPAGSVRRFLIRKRLGLLFGGAFVLSFLYSVQFSAASPGPAYFSTFTRVWQFAAGALVSVYLPRFARLLRSQRLQLWLGLAGMGLVVSSAFIIDETSIYPGSIALLPTLGAVLLIVAGGRFGDGGSAITRLLGRTPMVFVGTYSYGIYLLHWPALVLAEAEYGTLDWPVKVMISLGSVPVSWLLTTAIETPVRRARVFEGIVAPFVLLAISVNVGLVGAFALERGVPSEEVVVAAEDELEAIQEAAAAALDSPPAVEGATADPATDDSAPNGAPGLETSTFGAQVLGSDPSAAWPLVAEDNPASITPDPVSASQDTGALRNCRASLESSDVHDCSVGPSGSRRVALVGDSHAHQWATTLGAAAEVLHFRLDVFTKEGCPYTQLDILRSGRPYDSCSAWNDEVRERLLVGGYDWAIFSSIDRVEPSVEELAGSYATLWAELIEAGVQPLALLGTRDPPQDMPTCVVEHRTSVSACEFAAEPSTASLQLAAARLSTPTIDLSDWICPAGECPAVVGGVLLYIDGNHVSNTYALSLLPQLTTQLATLLDS